MDHSFHSNGLQGLLAALHKQNTVLAKSRDEYLSLEASKAYEEALLIKRAEGKSHAEKTTNAKGTEEWLVLHKRLARAESIYEFEKIKLSILEKEYQAQYLQLKMDLNFIKRDI